MVLNIKYGFQSVLIYFSKLRREEGYALGYILIVSFLIISLLLSFLTMLYYTHILNLRLLKKEKLELVAVSAAEEYIYAPAGRTDSNDSSITKVNVHAKYSGLLLKTVTGARQGRDSIKLAQIWGSRPANAFSNALVISRPNLRAAVAGNTLINGDMLMTEGRINENGTIFGVINRHGSFITGKVRERETVGIKAYNDSLLQKLFGDNSFTKISDGSQERSGSRLVLNTEELVVDTVFLKRLGNSIQEVAVRGEIIFKNRTRLSRALTFKSGKGITVGRESLLENLIFVSMDSITIAPKCTLKNVQLIAKKGITMNESVGYYPSLCCLYVTTADSTDHKEELKLIGSVFNGTLMLVTDVTGINKNKSKIIIDEESKVQGVVYSENHLELYGDVLGTVYTNRLVYRKGKKEYYDWLVNLDINRSGLDKNFLLPAGFGKRRSLAILSEEWIN